MRITTSLLVALLATSATAQIKMSDYVRTFSSSLTRGFFFTAPGDFTVTHLQVPDEMPSTASGDVQTVAIYKLSAAPPAFSATVKATPVFYDDTMPAGVRIALKTPIKYTKGDVLAILGGMSAPSSNIRNSYGAAKVASSVLGMPITLERCGMQININTTKGVGDMWSEVNGPIARVRVWVQGHGSSEQYGKGAPGAILDYADANPMSIGGTGGVTVRSLNTNNGSALSIGLVRINVPSPFNGNLLSSPTLFLLINATAVPTGRGANSGTKYLFPIANNKSLLGVKLTMQAGIGSATAPLSLTNGMEVVVGN